ncbi:MAG: hypothetical protein ACFFEY_08490 [Candidatus Thorarchaeota archaeon]
MSEKELLMLFVIQTTELSANPITLLSQTCCPTLPIFLSHGNGIEAL